MTKKNLWRLDELMEGDAGHTRRCVVGFSAVLSSCNVHCWQRRIQKRDEEPLRDAGKVQFT